MTLVGLTWFIGTLDQSGIPLVSEIALALEDTTSVILLALVLAYPSGKLETRVDRVAVAILAVGATALNVLYSTSLTIIADKSTGLYGGLALATMTTRRGRPSLADRTASRRAGSWRPSSSPASSSLPA